MWFTVFAKINARPKINAHPMWALNKNSDSSKGGVHKTDGFWWVKKILFLQKLSARGVYFGKNRIRQNKRPSQNKRPPHVSAQQKQWFFKGGSTQNRWLSMGLKIFISSKIKRPGRLFWIMRCRCSSNYPSVVLIRYSTCPGIFL